MFFRSCGCMNTGYTASCTAFLPSSAERGALYQATPLMVQIVVVSLLFVYSRVGRSGTRRFRLCCVCTFSIYFVPPCVSHRLSVHAVFCFPPLVFSLFCCYGGPLFLGPNIVGKHSELCRFLCAP